MRNLIYIPITHGSWEDKKSVDCYFQIRRYFGSEFYNVHSDIKKIFVYVDSLPILTSKEDLLTKKQKGLNTDNDYKNVKSYVNFVKKSNDRRPSVSLIYNLDKMLKDKKVRFIGTEPLHLIYDDNDMNINDIISNIQIRDPLIGTRINDTLKNNILGILFVGSQHKVFDYLSEDIILTYPIGFPNPTIPISYR